MKNTFEDFLQEKHGEEFVGTKDIIVDDYNDWLENLSIDNWIELGDKFRAKEIKPLLESLKKMTDMAWYAPLVNHPHDQVNQPYDRSDIEEAQKAIAQAIE